jgi:hypothetical protein
MQYKLSLSQIFRLSFCRLSAKRIAKNSAIPKFPVWYGIVPLMYF